MIELLFLLFIPDLDLVATVPHQGVFDTVIECKEHAASDYEDGTLEYVRAMVEAHSGKATHPIIKFECREEEHPA
jgi:hypothetical protein